MTVNQQLVLTQGLTIKAIAITGTLTSPQAETSLLSGRGGVLFKNESASNIYFTNSGSAAGDDYYTLAAGGSTGDEIFIAIDTNSVVTFYFAAASPTANYLKRVEFR